MSAKALFQISLKLILQNKKGELLALKAVDNGSFEGYYDLPGGRISCGEEFHDLSDILRREIKEELGDIDFSFYPVPVAYGRHLIPAKFTDSKKETYVLYLFFLGKYLGGRPKISSEHKGFQWIDWQRVNLKKYFKSGILEGVEMSKKYGRV